MPRITSVEYRETLDYVEFEEFERGESPDTVVAVVYDSVKK